MNPIVTVVLEKNQADIKAIVAKIGVDGLFELLPNITNILKTIQETQPKS
jgi:hypothetical protein